ncbi:DNA-3-methyladenine glycosylase [Allorhodopirellula heiligendammensis]|uniref:Putative 3-methyladenine DNA glycosylase n=1 Tax=Allorhodopirellula heiligendammensis TaxID=2714739 RepID=A0A5C6BWG5_9BACT|nr:DNA-3-methyladenine glycosylase [Allorhodopirellula heiligendammensis]TWU16610.1 3-methyladenine DNA glycosylase [Allorhodopirellula heiligendammensis]
MSLPPVQSSLNVEFFRRGPAEVARGLLGCGVAHRVDGRWLGGWIVETEAYLAQDDPASHSSRGLTAGNASMFGAPGTLYVYPIHAKHCMNLVTEDSGIGSAVLIRAIEPVWGMEQMQQNRGTTNHRRITSGPGMICHAMQIQRDCDGVEVLRSNDWRLTLGRDLRARIITSPRVGIRHAAELPLRFFVDGNRYVSGLAGLHNRPRRDEIGPANAHGTAHL